MTVQIGIIEGAIKLRDEFTGVLDKAAGKLDTAAQGLTRVGSRMSSIGSTLFTRITVPLIAAGGASVKFATDFESSFAGVRKTVDATEEEFAELSQGFRDMAKEIPINVNELNNIGEAAGQLGIETQHILSFTRTMADLGVATNLSSDQAATALARLANITGLPQTEFDRLGSTIVALGNNFATTESEIVEMGLRLAGAGEAVGMSEGQILALSTALTSVGINAEAGGSAFSRVIKDMATSVAVGGEAVQGFADVAGVSIDEFSRLFREDAASALELFIEGLGRMTAEDKLRALDELGFSGIRVSDALIRTSGAGDLLARTLDLQAVAWRDNTALAEEAEQRYKTFESKVTIFWNRLKDLGITLGNLIIPKLEDLLEAVSPVIDYFQDLSDDTQTIILAIGGLVAAIGPAILILGNIATAAGALGITLAGVGTAISTTLGVIFGPVGLIAAGAAILLSWRPAREFLWDLGVRVFSTLRDWITSFWKETEIARTFLVNLGRVIVDDVITSIQSFITGVRDSIEQGGFWSVVIDTISGSISMLVGWVVDLVKWVGESISSIKESIATGGTWSIVWDTVTGSVRTLIEWLRNLFPALDWLITKMEGWISKATDLTTELDESASAGRSWGKAMEESASGGTSWAEAADDAANSASTLGGEVVESGGKVADFGNVSKDSADKVSALNVKVFDAAPLLNGMSGAAKDARDATIALKMSADALTRSMEDGNLTTEESEELLKDLKAAYDAGHMTLLQYERAVESVKDRTEEATEATKEHASAFQFAEKAARAYAKFMSTKLGQVLDGIGRHIGEISNIVGELFGEGAQREVEQWGAVLNQGLNAFASFASGDIVGGVVQSIGAIKGAFDNLFPSTMLVEERIATFIQHFRDGEGTVDHWNRLVYDLSRTLEKVAEEGWDASRAADIMNESFNDFVDIAITMGDEGYAAIAQIVQGANEAGVGLEVIAERLRDTWDELSDVIEQRNAFIIDQTNAMVDGLITMLGETGNVTRQEIEFAGISIMQAFSQMLNAGVPVVEIVERLGDTFDLVNDQGQLMGVDLGEEFGNLGELFELLADEKIQRVIERLDGMTAAAEAAANMGLLTVEQFDAWENRLVATFNRLVDGGASSEVALAALQGPLQALFNASQQYGFQVDANAQKLLDMALAQGVVTDMGMTQEDILIRGFDRMIEGLNRLIQALGGVPIAMETWGNAAEDVGTRMGGVGDEGVQIADHIRDSWERATDAINDNNRAANNARENAHSDDDGGGSNGVESGNRPGFQGGSSGYLNFGSKGRTIDVHGDEQIVTRNQGASIAAQVGVAIESAMRVGGGELATDLLREILRGIHQNTRAFERASSEIAAMKARMNTERM